MYKSSICARFEFHSLIVVNHSRFELSARLPARRWKIIFHSRCEKTFCFAFVFISPNSSQSPVASKRRPFKATLFTCCVPPAKKETSGLCFVSWGDAKKGNHATRRCMRALLVELSCFSAVQGSMCL